MELECNNIHSIYTTPFDDCIGNLNKKLDVPNPVS